MKHSDYIRRFLAEGKTEQEYYAWSRLCGIKASHSYKDSLLRERFDVQHVSEFGTWPPIDELNLQSLEELNHYILFECRNPADLALCYLELLRSQPDDHTREGFLNENLRPFPRKSFLRFGDKNWLPDVSPLVSTCWSEFERFKGTTFSITKDVQLSPADLAKFSFKNRVHIKGVDYWVSNLKVVLQPNARVYTGQVELWKA